MIDNVYNHYSTPSEFYFMAGQSNMAGRDVDGTSLTSRDNDADIYEYNRDASHLRSFSTIYPEGGTIENFGPNVGLLRTRYNQTTNKIISFRYAVGGHCLPSFLPESERLIDPQSELPSSNADRSQGMIDLFAKKSFLEYRKNFNKPVKTFLIWYQGSEDSKYNGEQSYAHDLSGLYNSHLVKLLDYIKANVPLFDGEITIVRSPDWQAKNPIVKPYQEVVRAAQVNVGDSYPKAQWITSDVNQGVTATWEDNSHIDAASQERLGIDLASVIS